MRLDSSNLLVASGAVLALLASAGAQTEVRVVGTDLLGIEASRALYEFSGRAEFPLALAFDGSRPGLDQLKSGRADLALLSLRSEERDTLEGFESITLGYHCVVVLAPA